MTTIDAAPSPTYTAEFPNDTYAPSVLAETGQHTVGYAIRATENPKHVRVVWACTCGEHGEQVGPLRKAHDAMHTEGRQHSTSHDAEAVAR